MGPPRRASPDYTDAGPAGRGARRRSSPDYTDAGPGGRGQRGRSPERFDLGGPPRRRGRPSPSPPRRGGPPFGREPLPPLRGPLPLRRPMSRSPPPGRGPPEGGGRRGPPPLRRPMSRSPPPPRDRGGSSRRSGSPAGRSRGASPPLRQQEQQAAPPPVAANPMDAAALGELLYPEAWVGKARLRPRFVQARVHQSSSAEGQGRPALRQCGPNLRSTSYGAACIPCGACFITSRLFSRR